jgi:hypothetical protein
MRGVISALCIVAARAAPPHWATDGGTPQRTSSASLDTDITAYQPVSASAILDVSIKSVCVAGGAPAPCRGRAGE